MRAYINAALVTGTLAIVAQQALAGTPEIPAASPVGFQAANAFLDFAPITRIGAGPAAAVLAILAVLFTLRAWRRTLRESSPAGAMPVLRARLASAMRRDQVAEPPLSVADRRLLRDMLDGLGEQLRHQEDMAAARGHEPVVMRLVPQVPIRDYTRPRSWLGGDPALPEHVEWPEIHGSRAVFLAQIRCADLPNDLWGGAGPREGWLAFFIHPLRCAVRVLHVSELGPWRPGPEPSPESWFGALRYAKLPHAAKRAFPRWPVDLVAVRPGNPDPYRQGRSDAHYALYKQGYDLASSEHQPFDWPSTLAMLDILEAKLVERRKAISALPDTFRAQLDKAARTLAEAERDPRSVDELVRLRNAVHDLPLKIEAVARVGAALEALDPEVERAVATSREYADRIPFSAGAIESVMQSLHDLQWMHLHRSGEEESGPDGVDDWLRMRPLTVHDAEAPFWVHDFECLRYDWAKHAYSRSPTALPSPVRTFLEERWRDDAAHEAASMGHVPMGYVHAFDVAGDVTLLELPSSTLMGWTFGDVHSLVVTVKRADLAAGDFAEVTGQVTN